MQGAGEPRMLRPRLPAGFGSSSSSRNSAARPNAAAPGNGNEAPIRSSKSASKSVASCGADRISALPDAVLHRALGFLPAREAVQTCLLARRWRNLWRSLPRLRVTDVAPPGSAVEPVNRFVNGLLLLRDRGAGLDQCEIHLPGFEGPLDPICISIWIQNALRLGARKLRLDLKTREPRLHVTLPDRRLVSSYLKVLHLHGAELVSNVLDFSGCPVLEDLQITYCEIYAAHIWSPSSKRPTMVDCSLNPEDPGRSFTISAPGLTRLKLECWVVMTPLVDDMPLLEAASIMSDCCCDAFPVENCSANCCGGCCNCLENYKRTGDCVLLGGLSNATHLKFRASYGMVAFKRDLEHCPTFSNLKTLCLIDWCLAGDLHALLRFLWHAPNLVKLSLQLCQRKICGLEMQDSSLVEQTFGLEMQDSSLVEQTFSLRKLKEVEVRCAKIDERVQKILQVMSPNGVGLKRFNIQKI